MPSEQITALCNSQDTLTHAVAENPCKEIQKIAKEMYKKTGHLKKLQNTLHTKPNENEPGPSQDELDAVAKCGKFPHRPSELFLKMFHDALNCLERDPFVDCCSPPLIGSSGVIPVSVISIIPDIMRHYANVILTAEHEVFLATNFLQKSKSLSIVCHAFKELSKKAGERGTRIVVKFMYDRGTPQQLVHNHAPVKPSEWDGVGLPTEDDIPNIDMEVVNYHRPLLGTFHSKMMVVDRKVAILSSNNIQDRANVEMMVHLEGPIVESFYDVALWAWGNVMKPPLPLTKQPQRHDMQYQFGDENPLLHGIDLKKMAERARFQLRKQQSYGAPHIEHAVGGSAPPTDGEPVTLVGPAGADTDPSKAAVGGGIRAVNAGQAPSGGRGGLVGALHSAAGAVRYQNDGHTQAATGGPLKQGDIMEDVNAATMVHAARDGEKPGAVPKEDVEKVYRREEDIRDEEAARARGGQAKNPWREFEEEVQQEKKARGDAAESASTLSLSHAQSDSEPSTPATSEHPARREPAVSAQPDDEHSSRPDFGSTHGGNDSDAYPDDSEDGLDLSRMKEDGSLPHTKPVHSMKLDVLKPESSEADLAETGPGDDPAGSVAALSKHLNTGGGTGAEPSIGETHNVDDFRPFVVHAKHDPFPIALVNRPAHGMPGHEDILTPQNVAWLAGFKYAKHKVFIQSPTLNASPIVAAILDTCRRGVEVILWLNLGFNDQGEMIPFQGGTNEEVVTRLYKALNKESKGDNLKVYWYVGKDQRTPLNAAVKKRNCHIKFMAVDDEVAIVGNGNQDTQSWFHSMEVNAMVDSKQVVAEWMQALHANQNTELFGRLDREGVWRYEDGRPLENLNMMTGGGPLGRLKGFVGAINRATGKKPF